MTLRCHAVLALVSQGYPPPRDRSLRVTHPSATDSRNCPCDLHVLGMPPAFALSQDQTLRFITCPGNTQTYNEQTPSLSLHSRIYSNAGKKHPSTKANPSRPKATAPLSTITPNLPKSPKHPVTTPLSAATPRTPPAYPFLYSTLSTQMQFSKERRLPAGRRTVTGRRQGAVSSRGVRGCQTPCTDNPRSN